MACRVGYLSNNSSIVVVDNLNSEPPTYAGTDFIITHDGRITALYLFFDKIPEGLD